MVGTKAFLFLAQLGCTIFMTGLIWFVQIVHYPLFAEVGQGCLGRYETLHARRTGWVVFPPMVIELLTATVWLYPPLRPVCISKTMAWVLASLMGVLWGTTAFCQVPLHQHLGEGAAFEPERLIVLLVRSNWIRTAAWTARALLLLQALRCSLPT